MSSVEISASLVKELRERTGSGMMDCKKALIEAHGDIEQAIEVMRKSGMTKAAKKAGRIASEGVIVIKISDNKKRAAMLEVNSETDFVARDESFKEFSVLAAELAFSNHVNGVEALTALPVPSSSHTLEEARQALVAKIGENIHIRRLASRAEQTGAIYSYLHGNRIGVLLVLAREDEELGRDIAMHIAAAKPEVILTEHVPQTTIEKEREIFTAQAKESGKSDDIIRKMVDGRIQKFLNEISLVGQPYVKDPQKTVGQLLQEKGNKVIAFDRFEVGEGIEKKADNFVAEVMAQVRGS